jgi:hypothetical protein
MTGDCLTKLGLCSVRIMRADSIAMTSGMIEFRLASSERRVKGKRDESEAGLVSLEFPAIRTIRSEWRR